MIRVAIIDDHYVVRVGLKTIIDMDDELEFAGEASSGEGAAAFVVTAKPDVLLLDIRMPGRDGIETLEKMGCDYIQGFYFSRPLPPDQLDRLVSERAQAHVSVPSVFSKQSAARAFF